MISIEDVRKAVEKAGFRILNANVYVTEIQSPQNRDFMYLENTVGLDNARDHYIRLVLHPEFPVSTLRHLDGVSVSSSGLTHNSNMTSFPRRMHTGETPIHYGIPINIESLAALRSFLLALRQMEK